MGEANKRVVVADDDAELRKVVMLALARDGFEVVELGDGRELSRHLEDVERGAAPRPVVIIADVRMPAQSGLSVLASMQKRHVDIPVVLVTAFCDDATERLARRFGAAALFDKPFDLVEVRGVVRALASAVPRGEWKMMRCL